MIRRVNPRGFWATVIGAGAAYEAYVLHHDIEGATLSEFLRALFRVEKPIGKVLFAAGWIVFSTWFVPHIVIEAVDAVHEAVAEVTSPE